MKSLAVRYGTARVRMDTATGGGTAASTAAGGGEAGGAGQRQQPARRKAPPRPAEAVPLSRAMVGSPYVSQLEQLAAQSCFSSLSRFPGLHPASSCVAEQRLCCFRTQPIERPFIGSLSDDAAQRRKAIAAFTSLLGWCSGLSKLGAALLVDMSALASDDTAVSALRDELYLQAMMQAIGDPPQAASGSAIGAGSGPRHEHLLVGGHVLFRFVHLLPSHFRACAFLQLSLRPQMNNNNN